MRRRLRSVGQPLPTVELEVRDAAGRPVAPGEVGEIWVRGSEAGEHSAGPTCWRRAGSRRGQRLPDDAGYLYLDGRLDDVIVRGGENLSPDEIEDALVAHPSVAGTCVVGVPDVEWGEKVVAAAVVRDGASATEELQTWVRDRLRSTKTPERIEVWPELPYNDTGQAPAARRQGRAVSARRGRRRTGLVSRVSRSTGAAWRP